MKSITEPSKEYTKFAYEFLIDAGREMSDLTIKYYSNGARQALYMVKDHKYFYMDVNGVWVDNTYHLFKRITGIGGDADIDEITPEEANILAEHKGGKLL